jgi:ABC-type polysaccharide/polyol phosphate transport system ATPase subunit
VVDLIGSNLDRMRGRAQDVHSLTRGRIDATIWALRDVSFDVPEGAGVGVIGRNGAGKTTLLKLISRVTWPTSGRVRVAGRVVSLIELGAGFHPELTGRENVYLGGGLFGLTRRDIDRQFDRIVEFADVGAADRHADEALLVGLYARLGFSVAIHANPDIVLVDEVLAVGDAAFRRRALEALRQLMTDGKTVLFISHDMWNVRRLCDQVLWMEEGRVKDYGAAGRDRRTLHERGQRAGPRESGHRAAESSRRDGGDPLYRRRDVDTAGRTAVLFAPGDTLVVRASYRADSPGRRPVFLVAVIDVDTGLVITTATSRPGDAPDRVDASGTIECRFPRMPLRPRQYILRLGITDSHQLASYDVVSAGPRFAVSGHGAGVEGLADEEDGLVSCVRVCASHR